MGAGGVSGPVGAQEGARVLPVAVDGAHAQLAELGDALQRQVQITAAVRLGLSLRRVNFDMPVNLSDGASGTT